MGELVDLIMGTYGARYQLSREGVVQLINMIQKLALAKDLDGHLLFRDFPVYKQLNIDLDEYSVPVDADVGLSALGATSGATATLISYAEDGSSWVVEMTSEAEFEAGEVVTIVGGTGGGILEATEPVETYLGPYDFPEDARKVLGVTPFTDAQLFADPQYSQGDRTNPANDPDYFNGPSVADSRTLHLPARQNKLNRTLNLIYEPDEEATLRWRYYRAAPDILTEDDGENLLIPDEYHHTLIVQGVQALAHNQLYGEMAPEKVLEPFLKPYWQAMEDAYDPSGASGNQTSEGQP